MNINELVIIIRNNGWIWIFYLHMQNDANHIKQISYHIFMIIFTHTTTQQ